MDILRHPDAGRRNHLQAGLFEGRVLDVYKRQDMISVNRLQAVGNAARRTADPAGDVDEQRDVYKRQRVYRAKLPVIKITLPPAPCTGILTQYQIAGVASGTRTWNCLLYTSLVACRRFCAKDKGPRDHIHIRIILQLVV